MGPWRVTSGQILLLFQSQSFADKLDVGRGELVNHWFSGMGESLICSICPFLWCKYTHHGQFQAMACEVPELNGGRCTVAYYYTAFPLYRDNRFK